LAGEFKIAAGVFFRTPKPIQRSLIARGWDFAGMNRNDSQHNNSLAIVTISNANPAPGFLKARLFRPEICLNAYR
jgi:hypothetical protein